MSFGAKGDLVFALKISSTDQSGWLNLSSTVQIGKQFVKVDLITLTQIAKMMFVASQTKIER